MNIIRCKGYSASLNKNLADNLSQLAEPITLLNPGEIHLQLIAVLNLNRMKKYLSEKNALTVMVSLFCFIMMIVSLVKGQSLWETVAFALAFSFSVELICHRARENK